MRRGEDDEKQPQANSQLTEIEQHIRTWIEKEWESKQGILQKATREAWSPALTAVHIRAATLTVETLGPSLSSLTESTLRRRFQQCGATESPGEMIHRARMEHAARLLRDRRYTIEAVAAMSGFEDQRHFSMRFREHFKISPRRYRHHNGQT